MDKPADDKLIILDRDGVINEDSDDYIKALDEWVPVPGSIDAISRLSRAGYRIAVATNQSGLSRGFLSETTLADIHNLLSDLVEDCGGKIDVICYCPHLPSDNCHCRKPATGLLEQIEEALQIPVSGSYLIGDSLKDLQLAKAGLCIPILVRSGKGLQTEADLPEQLKQDIRVFDNLAAAVDHILAD